MPSLTMMTSHLLADVCIMFNLNDLQNDRYCAKCWGQNSVHNWIWGLASWSLQPIREEDIRHVTTHNMDNFISGKCHKGELQGAASLCNWSIWHRGKASLRDEHRAQEERGQEFAKWRGGCGTASRNAMLEGEVEGQWGWSVERWGLEWTEAGEISKDPPTGIAGCSRELCVYYERNRKTLAVFMHWGGTIISWWEDGPGSSADSRLGGCQWEGGWCGKKLWCQWDES